ncbi:hypothetical protein [Rhabdaerophilum calidifontis]|uniref:hypothetical protein n=1 Tax=Rhabdaerophilum calidifontis TaxID=2604328 RepID=UPI00123C78EA|nr:hypothetical protein [Rhabdaerophilum calidifontis]
MRHVTFPAFAALIAALLTLPMPGAAREEIPAETRERPWSAQLPACDDARVLGRIQSKFSEAERRYWNSPAEIVGFDKVRQAAFRPHGLDLIPRRYCQATAIMHDRRRLVLRYAVIEDAGPVGLFDDVQFCLDGYDRNYTAMPGCYRLDR